MASQTLSWNELREALASLKEAALATRYCKAPCRQLANRTDKLVSLLDGYAANPSITSQPEALKAWASILEMARSCRELALQAAALKAVIDNKKKKRLREELEDSLAALDGVVIDQVGMLLKVANTSSRAANGVTPVAPTSTEEHIRGLVFRLQAGRLEERLESAEALANVTASNPDAQRVVLLEGGLRPLVHLLEARGDPSVSLLQEHAVQALGNIAEGSTQGGHAVAGFEGAVGALLRVLQAGSARAQKGAADVLTGLVQRDAGAREGVAAEVQQLELVAFLKALYPDSFLLQESRADLVGSYSKELASWQQKLEDVRREKDAQLSYAQSQKQGEVQALLAELAAQKQALEDERERSQRELDRAQAEAERSRAQVEAQLRAHLERAESERGTRERELSELAWNALKDVKAQKTIAQQRYITLLAIVLRWGTSEAQIRAAEAISDLAVNESNRRTLAAYGGIPPLVDLLRAGGSPQVQEMAAAALLSLSFDDGNRKEVAAHGAVPLLVELLTSECAEVKETGAAVLWSLAEDEDNRKLIRRQPRALSLLRELQEGGSDGAKETAGKALKRLE